MNSRRIDFANIPWAITPGVKVKAYEGQAYKIRIIEFNEDFVEEDWCQNGHYGYVLDGEMNIDFNGDIIHYRKGDGLYIPAGSEDKHKAIIAKGKFVRLLLVEEN